MSPVVFKGCSKRCCSRGGIEKEGKVKLVGPEMEIDYFGLLGPGDACFEIYGITDL